MAVTKKKSVTEKSMQQKWRDVMEAKGIKQSWVAEQAGISPEHFSNILAERVLLTDENKIKINEILGTNN